jgi:hypothetical protein
LKIKHIFKFEAIPFIVIGLVFICLLVFSLLQKKKINKQGKIAIAKVIEASMSKSGTGVKAVYYYNGKTYFIHFLPASTFDLTIGRKFFIKFLPETAYGYDYYEMEIPNCVINDTNRVWSKFPTCD